MKKTFQAYYSIQKLFKKQFSEFKTKFSIFCIIFSDFIYLIHLNIKKAESIENFQPFLLINSVI